MWSLAHALHAHATKRGLGGNVRGMTEREAVRIANCSGFFGDRLSAAREMVEGGPIDVLTGDWLAELTMFILSRIRAKNPTGGYARTFVTQMEQVMGTCLDRGIRVVSNAGGLDPKACAEQLGVVADRLGLHPTIAYVDGDDLVDRVAELVGRGALRAFDDRQPLPDPERLVTANAYLGCWGIVEALTAGADIVVTGRVTDAAIVCGPAAWHHRWARDDWDRLAGAVVAGHVIECGAQATGGNYSFFTEIPDLRRPGLPWAEIAADGSSVIGKHDGTGGAVTVGTVTGQLLYEIGDHRYLGPDVTARFDTISLTRVGPDRVRISGVVGEPPPPTLKVATNELGGFRNEVVVGITGLDVEAKANLLHDQFAASCPTPLDEFDELSIQLVRSDHTDPASNEAATAQWRVVVKDAEQRKVGRSFSNSITELALTTIPGMYLLSGSPGDAQPYGVYRPALVDAAEVPNVVHLPGREPVLVSSVAPDHVERGAPSVPETVHSARVIPGPTIETEFGRVIGTRSGDKGGDANLGVFVRDDAAWDWLVDFLTVDRLRSLLPEVGPLRVERHVFANLRAVNFVVRGLLQEGVAASTRIDAQAKSLGEWLRARVVELPAALLP